MRTHTYDSCTTDSSTRTVVHIVPSADGVVPDRGEREV